MSTAFGFGAKRLMPRIALNNSRASMTAARNVFTRLEVAEEAKLLSQHMKWITVTFAQKKHEIHTRVFPI